MKLETVTHRSVGRRAAAIPFSAGERPQAIQRMLIGNVGIDICSREAFIAALIDHAENGMKTHQVVTINSQFYTLADESLVFRSVLQQAEFACADGTPLAWLCSFFAGKSVPRIAGVDLVDDLCERAAKSGLRVFLLGGSADTAYSAGEILCRRYPSLQIVGTDPAPRGFDKDPVSLRNVLDNVARTRPHIVFVGFGAPRQEYFIDRHIRPLAIPIAIGVGGSFRIVCGDCRRAPAWMQRSGLEWAFRLGQDPRRLWKRYIFGNAQFAWGVSRWAITLRKKQNVWSASKGGANVAAPTRGVSLSGKVRAARLWQSVAADSQLAATSERAASR